MATFRGTVQGARGEASRLGHSELTTECNGWNAGITVYAQKDKDGEITFTVYQTGGSNGGRHDTRPLGTLHASTLIWTPADKEQS